MRRWYRYVILCTGLVVFMATGAGAQGPPIFTDTPIMLGLQGRGVRTFAKFIRKSTLRRDGNKISDDLNRRVTVRVTPIALPFNLFSDRFQIGTILPLMDINFKSTMQNMSSSGMGDIKVFLKYLLAQVDRRNETFRVAAKAGVKLPTGDENKNPALGTGSTDGFFTSVAGWIKGRTGVYVEGIYGLNTSNDRVDFGNSFSYNLALGYRLIPAVYETYPSPQLNGFIEINGTTSNRDRLAGKEVENSGGTVVFLSPGLQYVGGRRWLIEAAFQFPVVHELHGTRLTTQWSFFLGTRLLLF